MKYLTKEWYELCQKTGLHVLMRVHKGAQMRDDVLYERLYKRKEKEHVNLQREVYDLDPRELYETMVPIDEIIQDADEEQKTFYYQMVEDERANIQRAIAEYDARPPFDELACKQQFRENQEYAQQHAAAQLPVEIYNQIADIRVFALGYCTKEIKDQLRTLSKENERQVEDTMKAYSKAQNAQHIPANIREKVNFHDCLVTQLTLEPQFVIRLDPSGGFTLDNKVTFTSAEVIQMDEGILDSHWIYDEIYRTEQGYEVHVLFHGKGLPELVVRCQDIVVERE